MNFRASPPAKRGGFSMVEILVTLAISAMVLGIAVPSFLALMNAKHVRSATEDLVSYIRIANSEALKRKNNFFISFMQGENWCYGLSNLGPCDCSADDNCLVDNAEVTVHSTQYTGQNSSLTVTGFSGTPVTIEFQGNLGVVLNDGSVTINAGEASATTLVNHRGLASVCSDSLAGYYGACP